MNHVTVTAVPAVLPVAAAPTVTIRAILSVAENATQALAASVSGGAYDTLAYAWTVVSGGGHITGSGSDVTYNPPNVTAQTTIRVRCTVTARGTGTVARAGTTANASDDELFNVTAVTTVSAPGAPASGPPVTVTGNTVLRITSFAAPTNTGGAPLTGYRIRHRVGSGGWTVIIKTGTTGGYNITGLTAGTTYELQYAGVNRVGIGAYSAGTMATTSGGVVASAPAKSAKPVLAISGDDLTLTWVLPTAGSSATSSQNAELWWRNADGVGVLGAHRRDRQHLGRLHALERLEQSIERPPVPRPLPGREQCWKRPMVGLVEHRHLFGFGGCECTVRCADRFKCERNYPLLGRSHRRHKLRYLLVRHWFFFPADR